MLDRFIAPEAPCLLNFIKSLKPFAKLWLNIYKNSSFKDITSTCYLPCCFFWVDDQSISHKIKTNWLVISLKLLVEIEWNLKGTVFIQCLFGSWKFRFLVLFTTKFWGVENSLNCFEKRMVRPCCFFFFASQLGDGPAVPPDYASCLFVNDFSTSQQH